ncbi:hypothetical protein HNQ56_002402 [Anaerotaenia torta]|uniref:leucine-rich repeat domain-containing protein n=1 Tax=Anaerotaenia torta TaxID=433293 RepID=UPI003D25D7CA
MKRKVVEWIKRVVVIMFILSCINLPTYVAARDEADMIGNAYSGTHFYTHETEEYLINPTDNLLEFSELSYKGEDTGMVEVTGAYLLDEEGNIDRETCAENITIPSTVTWNGKEYKVVSIGGQAFLWKKVLKKITLPDSLIKIKGDCFLGAGITEINIPEGVTTLGGKAFYYTDIAEIFIPKNVTTISEGALANCQFLRKITVDKENKYFKTDEDEKILYTKDGKELLLAIASSNSFIVEEGVEVIRAYAFSCNYFSIDSVSNGYYITKLTLPKTLKYLRSVPDTLDIIEFKSKNPPVIDCVILSDPVIVPKGAEKAYSKVTYNLQDILPSIVSSVKTLKHNEKFIKEIPQSDFNNSLKREISKDVKKVAQSIMKKYKTDRDRYIAVHRYIVENFTEDPSMYLYGYGNSQHSTASKVLKHKIFTVEGVEDLRSQLLTACKIKNLVIPYSKNGRTDKQYLLNVAIVDDKRVLSDVTFENACLTTFKDRKQDLDLSHVNVFGGNFIPLETLSVLGYKLGEK